MWDGEYLFCCEGHGTGSELALIPTTYWERIKSEKFYLDLTGDTWFQINVTTSLQSISYTGGNIEPGNPLLSDLGEGNYTLTLDFANEPIKDLIDSENLLFHGGMYTPQKLYFKGSEPPGPTPPTPTGVIWENDGSHGEVDWSGTYRFSSVEKSSGEEIYAIPMEQWEGIKTSTFYLDLEATDPQIRVTTGWWSTKWTDEDISIGNPLLTDNQDGTFTLKINFANDPIIDVLDDQHLLFTGQYYTPLKLYFDNGPEPPEPEPDPREIVWENDGSHGATNWDYEYLFVGPDYKYGDYFTPLKTYETDVWNRLKIETFYLDFTISSVSDFRAMVTSCGWNSNWPHGSNEKGDFVFIYDGDKLITNNQDGTYTLTINFHQGEDITILDCMDEEGILLNGQHYTPLRLYFLDKGEESLPLNIPLLAGSIGGGVGLALLLAVIFILVRRKFIKIDNIAYAKKASIDPSFDEYVVSFNYKKRKFNYFIFEEKKARTTIKDAKKEFANDQRNGKLKKYLKKLLSR